jgi:4-hydroxybenzoate polyprenyltransferase
MPVAVTTKRETRASSPLKLPLLLASFVKLEHSVFALPFAYAGAFVASNRIPGFWRMLWITVAMVAARSLAMGLNRIIDYEIDSRNPRTAGRELPSGRLSLSAAFAFLAVSLAALGLALFHLPRITWYLSPVVIAAFVIYPYTKRFTSMCHVFLGLTIGLAPVGGWVAVNGDLAWQPFLLMSAVTFWIAGFDIIYACLDIDFDRREGLHSLPASLGAGASLLITKSFHLLSVLLLVAVGMVQGLGMLYFAGVAVVATLLAYENAIVSARDLSRVNTAFMTMNGIISVVYLIFLTLDLVI